MDRATLDAERLNLAWLLRLRWVMLAATAVVLVMAVLTRGVHVHTAAVVALLAGGAVSNVLLLRWLQRVQAVAVWVPGAVLALDVVLLTLLLVQSGGYSNPASFLFMVHVALGAMLLGTRGMWGVLALCLVASGGLAFEHQSHGQHHDADAAGGSPESAHLDTSAREHARLHVEGMWVSFAVIAYFVTRVRRALAVREAELATERTRVLRQERLASLATLAAGAAHELATPLGTIATVARELERTTTAALTDDARLIRQEVERCRAILDQMAFDVGADAADPVRRLRVSELIESTLQGVRARERVRIEMTEATGNTLAEVPPRALAQALRAAVHNALDASPPAAPVALRVDATANALDIRVEDQGPGMEPDVLARAGEPFFTTKEPGRGMGLGLFLTRAVVERLGGSLDLASAPAQGTTATVRLPLAPATTNRKGLT